MIANWTRMECDGFYGIAVSPTACVVPTPDEGVGFSRVFRPRPTMPMKGRETHGQVHRCCGHAAAHAAG